MLSAILAITLLAPATSYLSRPAPALTPDELVVIASAEEVPAGYTDPALTTLLRHARQSGPGSVVLEDPELIRFSPGEDGHERALALGRSIVGRPMMFTVQLVRLVEHDEIPRGVEHWLARLPSDRCMLRASAPCPRRIRARMTSHRITLRSDVECSYDVAIGADSLSTLRPLLGVASSRTGRTPQHRIANRAWRTMYDYETA